MLGEQGWLDDVPEVPWNDGGADNDPPIYGARG